MGESYFQGKLKIIVLYTYLLNEGWNLKSFKHLFAIDFIRHLVCISGSDF